ncbi:MAG: hypothetical protein EOM64_00510 [Erysipelotrichia bacterium]|nr:hypothetical protein [Erysipelotrichia bacterium]
MTRRTGPIALVLAILLAGCAVLAESDRKETAMSTETPAVSETIGTSFLDFVREDSGRKIDLSSTAYLLVSVNHCEYGEPTQCIADSDIIHQAIQAVTDMRMIGMKDHVSSTGDSSGVGFYDENDKRLGSFTFQDGLYVGKQARYSVSGTAKLWDIEGIMGIDQWDAYWELEEEKESSYEYDYKLLYPADIFSISGYHQNKLNGIAVSDILAVSVSLKSQEKELETADPSVIEAVYHALSNMQAVSQKITDSSSSDWYIRIVYQNPGETFASSTYLSFLGRVLVGDLVGKDDRVYAVTGMDELLDCDMENLKYLKEKLK